jgi:hypothetical protein
MSFAHRIVLPLAGVAAALSMVTISLAAETSPPTPPNRASLPAACQLHTDATPTAKVVSAEDENDNDDGEINSTQREAIRACIEALRADGKDDLREIIAWIARARAERNNHGPEHEHEQNDDKESTATATPTRTATATPEHRGGHTPPEHQRD